MKSLAPYFGNRFATVAAKTKKSARKVKPAVSEMEALESRILLSGIVADGTKSYKKLTYTDLEGDKVTISVSQGSFTILGTNGDSSNELLSVDQITLSDSTAKSTLSIKVANVNPNKNGDAFTEIGEITSSSKAIKSITFDGANVANLNLADTSVGSVSATGASTGGIFLKASAANILDRINVAGNNNSSLAQVNYNNISVESVSRIQASTQGYGLGKGLNFDGSIVVDSGSVAIIGSTSEVKGSIVANNISNINVGKIDGQVTTAGDLVLNVSDGASIGGAAVFTVGKNLHLSILTGGLGAADFFVTGSISGGNSASTTDVVAINGVVNGTTFKTDSTFAGITVKGGDATFTLAELTAGGDGITSIGDVTVTQGKLTATLTADGNIGNITVRDAITNAIDSTEGSVGNISADSAVNISAETSIGNLTFDNGGAGNIEAGTLTASAATGGNIGNISATSNVGTVTTYAGSIGSITLSNGADIGDITAGAANLTTRAATGGDIGAITMTGAGSVLDKVTAHKGNIGSISIADGYISDVISAGSGKQGTNGLVGGNIGNITASNTTAAQETLQANIISYNGNVGNVTITNLYNTALKAAVVSGVAIQGSNIGNVTVLGTATSGNTNALAFNNLTIGSITTGNSTAQVGTGAIGNINVSGEITGTLTLNGRASGGGFIGASVGNVIVVDDDVTDVATIDLVNVNNIDDLSSAIGDLTITGNATTLANITDIGNISAGNDLSLMSGTAIGTGNFDLTIGTVSAGNDAILTAITATGASATITIGNIIVADTLTFEGDIVTATATQSVSIGTINAVALDNTAGGLVTIGSASNTGSIGLITLESNVTATAGDNIQFEFTTFNGKTAATANTTKAVDFSVASGITDITTANIAAAPVTSVDLVFRYA